MRIAFRSREEAYDNRARRRRRRAIAASDVSAASQAIAGSGTSTAPTSHCAIVSGSSPSTGRGKPR